MIYHSLNLLFAKLNRGHLITIAMCLSWEKIPGFNVAEKTWQTPVEAKNYLHLNLIFFN